MKKRYAKSDFSPASLPVTRKQLFVDHYRNNRKVIFKAGWMLALFALPLIAFRIFFYFGYMGITEEHYGEQFDTMMLLWNGFFYLGTILLFIPILIAVFGFLRVFRYLNWGEGVDFFHLFGKGIKDNFRASWLPSLIFLFLWALSMAAALFFGGALFSYAALLIFFLVFCPIYGWMVLLGNVYEGGFGARFSSACFFFGKSIPVSLLFLIGLCLPFAFDFIPLAVSPTYLAIRYSAVTLLLLFYYPPLLIAILLYADARFDIHINCESYPEIYRKGLYDPAGIYVSSRKSSTSKHL